MRRGWLWKADASNKPLEWTGRRQAVAKPPQAPYLPLRDSVREMGGDAVAAQSRYTPCIAAGLLCRHGSRNGETVLG